MKTLNINPKMFGILGLCGSVVMLLPFGAIHGQAVPAHEAPLRYVLTLTPVEDAAAVSRRSVYVLDGPGRAASVFEVLASVPMQKSLSSLPRGAELYYTGGGGLEIMAQYQKEQALFAHCKQHGLKLIEAPTD